MAYRPGTVVLLKNGLRETSKAVIKNAAWQELPDGKNIIYLADISPNDIFIVRGKPL